MTLVAMWKKRGWIAACLLAGALSVWTPAASGCHPGTTPADEFGLSESELRQAETEALGAGHAAEHAEQRALAQQAGWPGPPSAADEPALRLAGPPDQVGQWEAPFPIPIFGIHAVVLPTGKVMWWSYPFGCGEPRQNTAEAWLWDPATGASTRVDPPQVPDPDNPGQTVAANIWCSGQALLADGRVLVTGGNLDYEAGAPERLEGPQQGLHV